MNNAEASLENRSPIQSSMRAQGATQLFCGTTYRPGYCLADQTIAPLFALQKEGLHGQGAIESQFAATAGTLRAQGATEYLVLLAVVLVIALVAIALLGFFPGMAGDAQETQSKMYWQSATPIAIVEQSMAHFYLSGHGNATLFRVTLRNTGSYPITITKLLGGDNYSSIIQSQGVPLTIAPGAEDCLGGSSLLPALNCLKYTWIQTPATPTDYSADILRGADSICSPNGKGRLIIRNFGFEYTTTIERVTLTKRQIGKTIYADCSNGAS